MRAIRVITLYLREQCLGHHARVLTAAGPICVYAFSSLKGEARFEFVPFDLPASVAAAAEAPVAGLEPGHCNGGGHLVFRTPEPLTLSPQTAAL